MLELQQEKAREHIHSQVKASIEAGSYEQFDKFLDMQASRYGLSALAIDSTLSAELYKLEVEKNKAVYNFIGKLRSDLCNSDKSESNINKQIEALEEDIKASKIGQSNPVEV